MNLTTLSGFAAASILCATAQAQITNQNDCNNSGLDNVGPGVWNFDTSAATTGTQGQSETSCYEAGTTNIAGDIWCTYTATADTITTIETCGIGGSNYDTKIAVWPGSPACPADGSSIACNDDDCGLRSRLSFPVTNGTSYIIQIGNFPGAVAGSGVLTITEPPPPAAGCFTDLTSFLTECGSVTDSEDFSGFPVDTPFDIPGGIPIGIGMNLEALNPIGFRNLVDTPPFFPPVNHNGTNHASCFTDWDPPSLEIEIDLGQSAGGFGCVVSEAIGMEMAEMQVWSGGALVQTCTVASNSVTQFVGYLGTVDRIRFVSATQMGGVVGQTFGLDDIIICAGAGPIGTSDPACSPVVPNSTGVSATMSAIGSTSIGAMDVRLSVDNVPTGEFGIFFTSQTLQWFPNPGGSLGNICLTGDAGRFNGPPQIFTGAGAGSPVPPGGRQIGNIPIPLGTGTIPAFTPGTWYFQAWYRDIGGNNNFSDALQIVFIP